MRKLDMAMAAGMAGLREDLVALVMVVNRVRARLEWVESTMRVRGGRPGLAGRVMRIESRVVRTAERWVVRGSALVLEAHGWEERLEPLEGLLLWRESDQEQKCKYRPQMSNEYSPIHVSSSGITLPTPSLRTLHEKHIPHLFQSRA